MKNGLALCVVMLATLATQRPAAAAWRGLRTCRCQLEPDLYQSGKLVGSSCYVAGVGRCSSYSVQPSWSSSWSGASSSYRRPTSTFGSRRRLTSRLGSTLSSASPQRRYQAQLAARRQLREQRRQEQLMLRSGFGVVRPGTASAALASEKHADAKSLALGQQALAQILYLQNLVGSGK